MALADHITSIVKKLVEPTKYYGFYPYIVESFAGGRLFVRPLDPKYDVPPLKSVERIPGFTGADETFPTDSVVLIGFVGGNFAQPFVAFTQPVIPTSITVTVNGIMSVKFAGAALPVAKSGALNNYFTVLEVYLAAIVTAINGLVPGVSAAVAPATATFNAAASSAKSAMPTSHFRAE